MFYGMVVLKGKIKIVRLTLSFDLVEGLTVVLSVGFRNGYRLVNNNRCVMRSLCGISGSTTPFVMRVQFGPGNREENPEDNLGMCIRYEQQLCSS